MMNQSRILFYPTILMIVLMTVLLNQVKGKVDHLQEDYNSDGTVRHPRGSINLSEEDENQESPHAQCDTTTTKPGCSCKTNSNCGSDQCCNGVCCADGEDCVQGFGCCGSQRICNTAQSTVCCANGTLCFGSTCCPVENIGARSSTDNTLICCSLPNQNIANVCCQGKQACGPTQCCQNVCCNGTCCPNETPVCCTTCESNKTLVCSTKDKCK